MIDVQTSLETLVQKATERALGPEYAKSDPMLRPVKDPSFGDYQANLAMPLGKALGRAPREIALQIAAELKPGELLSKVEIAGPGFINLTVSERFLEASIAAMALSRRLGVSPVSDANAVVIDYAGPNCAKEMHVGHLRSAIIGDALSRVLEFSGHRVIRQNHVGDWGTQFGMLLEDLIDQGWDHSARHAISDLNALYQQAKQRFDQDAEFAERARLRVVKLQSGDSDSLKIWQALIDESIRHMNEIFGELGIRLTNDDLRPESFYNPRLGAVLDDLGKVGLLQRSEGAQVVFPEGFKDREGDPLPMIVQKSDGGFGYAATDLAAACFRIRELGAKRVVYVVDSRQSDHFAMLFSVLRAAGWSEGVSLEHVAFGTILGKDKKPFKTREGGVVRLKEVLAEAVERAGRVIAGKNEELDQSVRQQIARAVGIGALKYADLSSDRVKDYVFDWDRMLALEGNTAPYLQNAYVRIRSIFRKGGIDEQALRSQAIRLEASEERSLALAIVQLPQAIDTVARTLEPHKLCGYLYELASGFHRFYEKCPVLKAEGEVRASRLALSALSGRVLALGLELLGIEVVERM